MTRAELDQAIVRLVDAERHCQLVIDTASNTGKLVTARSFVKDARSDLDDLLDLLDEEMAFTP